MEKKITKREMFAKIREVVINDADMVSFIDHEIELLNKKASAKKPTKAQKENLALMDKVVEVLAKFPNGATASEVLNASAEFDGMSNQKISALLKKCVEVGTVEKKTDKKKSIFSVVA